MRTLPFRLCTAGMVLAACSLAMAWIPPDTIRHSPPRVEPVAWAPIPLDDGNLTVLGPSVMPLKPPHFSISVWGEYSPPSWQALEECSIDLWVKPTSTGVWELVDTYSFANGADYVLTGSTNHHTHPISAPPPYSFQLIVYNAQDIVLYDYTGAGDYDVDDWSTNSPMWNK
jgi:hypothetical protein